MALGQAQRRLKRAEDNSRRRIYAVVSRIQRGRVATYGQVARLAGLPNQARLVGYALSDLPDHSRLPWHRVINAKGAISLRSDDGPASIVQRIRLEREGVAFDDQERVSLARFRWMPRFARSKR
jgi:methylated-DNA-protein-cysteine methyltransferase related protein